MNSALYIYFPTHWILIIKTFSFLIWPVWLNWCRVLFNKLKSCGFNSRSGHVSRFSSGPSTLERQSRDPCFSASVSPAFPLSLKSISMLSCLVWLNGLSAWPGNWSITRFIPSQGTCLVCGPGQVPSRGPVRGNHTLMFFILSFSLPPPP